MWQVPNPKAGAPGPSVLDPTTFDHPDLPGKATPAVAQGPGASAADQTDIFNTIIGQMKDTSNPLNNIIIGRKLLEEVSMPPTHSLTQHAVSGCVHPVP